jgi:hypothetical protein
MGPDGAASSRGPAWLPEIVFEWAEKVGLPAGHPGLVVPHDKIELPQQPNFLAVSVT